MREMDTTQNFCPFHVSNSSVLNFRIFLLVYPGSARSPRVRAGAKAIVTHAFNQAAVSIVIVGDAVWTLSIETAGL